MVVVSNAPADLRCSERARERPLRIVVSICISEYSNEKMELYYRSNSFLACWLHSSWAKFLITWFSDLNPVVLDQKMTLPQLFAHIDGIEAVLVLDKDGLPILKLPTADAVDQLDLQTLIPSAQMLQDQSQRMNLKKLKTIVTYWSARQIITYNVAPLVFIVAADTNVNTGALLNLYNDFQSIAGDELTNQL